MRDDKSQASEDYPENFLNACEHEYTIHNGARRNAWRRITQTHSCDRAKQRPCPQKQLPLSTSAEISMFNILYDLNYTPQDSLKIQIFPMSDFENGVARLLQLTRFGEVALRLLFVTM